MFQKKSFFSLFIQIFFFFFGTCVLNKAVRHFPVTRVVLQKASKVKQKESMFQHFTHIFVTHCCTLPAGSKCDIYNANFSYLTHLEHTLYYSGKSQTNKPVT